jgi:hypothetical protein
MAFNIDLKYEQRPMVAQCEIRTQEELDEFISALKLKWAEYNMPRTETWQGLQLNWKK